MQKYAMFEVAFGAEALQRFRAGFERLRAGMPLFASRPIPPTRPGDFEDLVTRFRSFLDRFRDQTIRSFKDRFQHLGARVAKGLSERREDAHAEAHEFNIFALLGIAEDEDRTHTPFLAELLNPRGVHGQGFLFLREFLTRCARRPGFFSPIGEPEEDHWLVDVQRTTRWGTIDLVLSAPRIGYLIAIENKIYAGEQADQVARYHRWLLAQRDTYQRRNLLFLTPTGRMARSSGKATYVPLSYRYDIISVLEGALPQVKAERVRVAIAEYREVVRSILPEETGDEERIRRSHLRVPGAQGEPSYRAGDWGPH